MHPGVAREHGDGGARALPPPHLADELHALLGGQADLMRTPWPDYDEAACGVLGDDRRAGHG